MKGNKQRTCAGSAFREDDLVMPQPPNTKRNIFHTRRQGCMLLWSSSRKLQEHIELAQKHGGIRQSFGLHVLCSASEPSQLLSDVLTDAVALILLPTMLSWTLPL